MDVTNTERSLAAMAGDCAAGSRLIRRFKVYALAHRPPYRFMNLLGNRRVHDENAFRHDVFLILQTVKHITLHAFGIIAAVLFADDHLVIHDLNARLQL